MKTVQDIAAFVGGDVKGEATLEIHTVGSLERATSGALTYADEHYLDRVVSSKASCVLVPSGEYPGQTVIVVANPRLAFARASTWLLTGVPPLQGIHPTAVIHPEAQLSLDAAVGAWTSLEAGVRVGQGTLIFPGCHLGTNVHIGSHCVIYPNVVLYSGVDVGDRTIIHAGTIIGSDGFGFVRDGAAYVKVPQVGQVRVGCDVEIGAHCCIDRGALDETVIGDGAKIDNLCQIAHNVQIGSHVIMSSQSGIAGSSKVGEHVTIGGQVGIADHCRIGDRAILGAQTGIPSRKKIPSDSIYWGSPARPLKEGKRLQAHFSRLPKLFDELKRLRSEVDALKSQLADITPG